jgi:hypothetical protein
MVCDTLFNWVDVSVACTSTPRLSVVNKATACCFAVLIIAHSTVFVLHGDISLDTVCVVCKLCREADTMYEHEARIRLGLVSRRTAFIMPASILSSILLQSGQKHDASYDSLWSYFQISSNFDIITGPKGR